MNKIIGALAALLLVALSHPAEAKHRHNHSVRVPEATGCLFTNEGRTVCGGSVKAASGHYYGSSDPRPHAWCGYFMRHHLGVADRAGNLARWWASYGTNARGPAIGAIVVWAHHVGIITGHTETGYIVLSGNDGHEVRERERSLRGAIAFRWPNGVAMQ